MISKCKNPRKCRVKTHRPGTETKCGVYVQPEANSVRMSRSELKFSRRKSSQDFIFKELLLFLEDDVIIGSINALQSLSYRPGGGDPIFVIALREQVNARLRYMGLLESHVAGVTERLESIKRQQTEADNKQRSIDQAPIGIHEQLRAFRDWAFDHGHNLDNRKNWVEAINKYGRAVGLSNNQMDSLYLIQSQNSD